MITNLHTHTTFSDGKNTPEEIVLTALEQGFCSIGFSDHAYTSYDISYCMNDEKGYIKEVRRLEHLLSREICEIGAFYFALSTKNDGRRALVRHLKIRPNVKLKIF